ncbi:uncharacterized protein DUF481 [Archangium gephyra]|uniref:Uncharacterized protein DUF481 n=1 Tax=Archangium gephyra TaxID=48 RepID=A0AAC8TFN6_9BACT|nr:DUF481 domain-containing protein [Archangium gephyra]AKJ04213.1 Hypothetical protein AA314_05839 [Archangium gephyra]REG37707.1 uncharacterized protein DUF481 [Archangium gephyra]
MLPAHALLSAFLTFQTPAPAQPATPAQPSTSEQSADRAAASAERAAAAAERAAEANARMAEAIESLARGIARTAPAEQPPAEQPPAEQKPETAAEKKEAAKKDVWDVTVGLGLIFITGNASTVTFNGLVAAERKTENWIYSVTASGVYGESRPPGLEGEVVTVSQVTALNAALQLRGDRRFTQKISGYLLGAVDADHVKSVEFRGAGEAGLGIIWLDTKRSDGGDAFLRTDLAFRYARETRFQYYPSRTDLPDVALSGPRFGAAFRYGIAKDVAFLEELSVLPSLIEGSRLVINSQTQLSVRLTQTLSIATTFLFLYDSEPAQGKLPTDTSLSVSAAISF